MALEAVHGGEHRDRRYRKPPAHELGSVTPGIFATPDQLLGERIIHTFAQGRARAVYDDQDRLLFIQLIEPGSERVLHEFPAQELATYDYHGVLVDVET